MSPPVSSSGVEADVEIVREALYELPKKELAEYTVSDSYPRILRRRDGAISALARLLVAFREGQERDRLERGDGQRPSVVEQDRIRDVALWVAAIDSKPIEERIEWVAKMRKQFDESFVPVSHVPPASTSSVSDAAQNALEEAALNALDVCSGWSMNMPDKERLTLIAKYLTEALSPPASSTREAPPQKKEDGDGGAVSSGGETQRLIQAISRYRMLVIPDFGDADEAEAAEELDFALANIWRVLLAAAPTAPWPRFDTSDLRLWQDADPFAPGDHYESAVENLFVRCYDCLGSAGDCESCGGTGFDFTDTVSARQTVIEALISITDEPCSSPNCPTCVSYREALEPFANPDVVFTCNCEHPTKDDCPFYYNVPNVAFEDAAAALAGSKDVAE